MPLTAYAAHVIILVALAGGPAGGQVDNAAYYPATMIGLLAAATAWAVLVGRGPLERVVARTADAMAGQSAR